MFDAFKTKEGAQRLWVFSFIATLFFGMITYTSLGDFISRIAFDACLYFIFYQIHLNILKLMNKNKELTQEEIDEGNAYALQQNKEKLKSRIKSNGVDEMDRAELDELLTGAGLAPAAGVVDTSEKIVGRFMDQDIHEWVMLKNPFTGETEKYIFYSGLVSGDPDDMPEEDDKTFALLGHIVYERT